MERVAGPRHVPFGRVQGVDKVYLHVEVITSGGYALGFPHTTKKPEAAVAVPHNDALPFYAERAIPVKMTN